MLKRKEIRVAFFQFMPRIGQVDYNTEFVISYLKEKSVSTDGIEIVVLPELALTGYDLTKEKFLKLSREATEEAYGEFIEVIEWVERKKGGRRLWIIGDARKEGGKVYNSAILLTSEGILGYYDKMHLFYEEKEKFERGSKIGLFEFEGVKIGVIICFDWIFPELTRTLALKGVKILCACTNLVLPYAQKAIWTRSVENRIYAVLANRFGRENNYTFTGKSLITSPDGLILAETDENSTTYISVRIDLEKASVKMITEKNHIFEDRHSLLKFAWEVQ